MPTDLTPTDAARLGYPDTIYVNGKVVTVDADFSIVDGFAVRGDRILATGNAASLRRLAGPTTQIVDLDCRTVLPGLIDTHAHVEAAGLQNHVVSFDGVATVAAALARVTAQAVHTPAGGWVRGGMWHPVAQLAEQRVLTRAELDGAAPDHPVCLPIGHFTLVNSRALALAGIDAETPDPAGGRIHRDPATGAANGTLEERAEDLVHALLPDWSDAERAAQIVDAMAYFNRHGLTSAISAAVDPATFRAHDAVRRRGAATLRISAMYAPTGGLSPTMSLEGWEDFFAKVGVASDFGDDWLSLSGIKLQIDGGMTLRTAAMRDGYPDDRDYHGTIVMEPARFDALVAIANRYGWRLGVHAVGDLAIDRVLDAYAQADAERSIVGRRFVIIHGSLIRPDQMVRAKKLGVRVDAQSAFLWDKAATVARYLGRDMADRAFPQRTLIDTMGLDSLGQGTDYPINPLDPFLNMFVMVTRRDKNGDTYGARERITREEAIRLYTSAAARYAFKEADLGSIEPGKLADFVVLSDDILTVPDEALKRLRVTRTVVGGRTVYDSGAA